MLYIRLLHTRKMNNLPVKTCCYVTAALCILGLCNSFPTLEYGSYNADAISFGSDCDAVCESGYMRMPVNAMDSISLSQACTHDEIKYECETYHTQVITWTSYECKDCKVVTPPQYFNDTTMAESDYIYNTDCSLQCLGLYRKRTSPDSCVLCDVDCGVGKYLKDEGECTDCEDCTFTLGNDPNLIFTSTGTIGVANSCNQQCQTGYYLSETIFEKSPMYTCVQHSNQECSDNEIFIEGTSVEDSRCEACITDCEGMREINECNTETNTQRKCEMCNEDLMPGETFKGNNCSKTCLDTHFRNDEGWCVTCQFICPIGSTFPRNRTYCEECATCTNKPNHSRYVYQCEWTCDEGYTYNAMERTCKLQQDVIPAVAPSGLIWYSFSCNYHQYWTMHGCVDCAYDNTPSRALQNTSWNWKRTHTSCSWECLPGYYAYGFSSDNWACLSWTEYLHQVETTEEIVASTNSAQFVVRVKKKGSVVREWQLIGVFVTFIFTSIYVVT